MRSLTFTEVSRRLVTTIGRIPGVNVVFKGNKACTDRSTVYLPALPAGVTISEEEAKVYYGYVDHEITHLRHSDWGALVQLTGKPKLQYEMANILEDVRCEILHIEEYPGTKDYLDALCAKLEGDLLVDLSSQASLDYPRKFVLALYEEAYSYRGRPKMCPEVETSDFFAELRALVSSVQVLQNTGDAIALSGKVYKLFEKYLKQEMDPPSQSAQPTSGDSQPGDSQPGDSQPGDSQPGDSQPDDSQPGDSQPDDSQPGDSDSGDSQSGDSQPGEFQPGKPQPGDSNSSSQGMTAKEYEEFTADMTKAVDEALKVLKELGNKSEAIQDIVKDIQEELKGTDDVSGQILPPVTTRNDQIMVYPTENMGEYTRSLGGVSTEVGLLKRALAVFLRSRDRKSWSRGMEEGQLDQNAIWKIRAGDAQRVYKQSREVTSVNTAVQVMVDLSSSMDADLTRTSLVVLAEALLGVQHLKLQICGFSTLPHSTNGNIGQGRTVPLYIPIFKSFEDSVQKARARIGGLNTVSFTPLGEAMAYGYESLVPRKETKKVLWIITDGKPYLTVADSSHSEYKLMAYIKEKCKKAGTQVIIMNLGRPLNLDDYADKIFHVIDLAGLPKGVLEVVRSLSEVR